MADTEVSSFATGVNSDFITEIRDDIQILEPDLLAMEEEKGSVSPDLINHAFRAIHSIKGGAGFCGLKDLGILSHSMENVLMRIRDGRLGITSEIVDALLYGLDRIKLMVDSLDSGESLPYEDAVKKLENILSPEEFTTIQTPEESFFKSMNFKIKKNDIKKAVDEGKFIYAVHFDSNRDLMAKEKKPEAIFRDIESAGDLLFFDLRKDLSEPELKGNLKGFYLIISTILDLDFIAEVLEVPLQEIFLFEPSALAPPVFVRSDVPEVKCDVQDPIDNGPEEKIVKEFIKQESPVATKKNKDPDTIRVNVDLITRLMNFAGELVLSRNQLRPLVEEAARKNAVMNSVMQNLDMVTTGIQEDIMQIRMQPVGNLLGRFNRIIRDTAKTLSKKVNYTVEGGDVELDRTVLEGLFNPMTHLMRNCVDHGIESPEDRKKAGKPETGTISIIAFHQGGNIHINIFDDGKGIDPEKVAAAALKKGIITDAIAEKMSDKEKIDLIFHPGLSTSDKVTDVSGRGVGMDVVKTNIADLRGHIDIDSIPGKGTTVQLLIPLTLAIVSALIVGIDKLRFAIPQANVSEVLFLKSVDFKNNLEKIGDSEVMRLRGRLLSVVRLRTLLNIDTFYLNPDTGRKNLDRRTKLADRRVKDKDAFNVELRSEKEDRRSSEMGGLYVVVIKVGVNRFGLCVEELFNNEEIVVKPLSDHIKGCKCFNGATILGDGGVIMILDASGMANHANLKFTIVSAEDERRVAKDRKKNLEDHDSKNVIVFFNAENEFFALELHKMTRLEVIAPEAIHRIGNLKFMEYQGKSISIFNLEEFIPVKPCVSDLKEIYVIIPKNLKTMCGIIVSGLVDIMEISQPLDKSKNTPEGVEGTAFVQGRLVQFLDMDKIKIKIESGKGLNSCPVA